MVLKSSSTFLNETTGLLKNPCMQVYDKKGRIVSKG